MDNDVHNRDAGNPERDKTDAPATPDVGGNSDSAQEPDVTTSPSESESLDSPETAPDDSCPTEGADLASAPAGAELEADAPERTSAEDSRDEGVASPDDAPAEDASAEPDETAPMGRAEAEGEPAEESASDDKATRADTSEKKRPDLSKALADVPRSKLVAGVVVAILGIAVAGYLAFTALMAAMPDLAGLTPTDAQEQLARASEAWQVTYVTDEGEPVDAADLESYDGYEVKATNPGTGTFLGKGGDTKVEVTIGKTEETIQKERQAIIDAEIQDSLANGWASEEYDDQGTYVEFRAYSKNHSTLAEGGGTYYYYDTNSYNASKDGNIELYRSMAEKLKSTVICACYTKDGYLGCLYVAPYAGASEAELAEAEQRVTAILDEAHDHNYQNADALLSTWCDAQQSYEQGQGRPVTIEYDITASEAYVYEMYGWDWMVWNGNAREQDESKRSEQQKAEWLAWVTGRNFTISYYTSNNEVFSTFSAAPDDFQVLVRIEPE